MDGGGTRERSTPVPKSGRRRDGGVRFVITLALTLGATLGLVETAAGKVFYAKDEALQLAFPEADTIEPRVFFLTPDQIRAIEARSGARLDSKLLTVHVGKRSGRVLGYALIDIHVVRTQPEASMVVLSPEGTIVSTVILAFHEPLEYLPPDRWLTQFRRKAAARELHVGREISGITGATLTAHAVTEAARKALAVYEVLLAPERR